MSVGRQIGKEWLVNGQNVLSKAKGVTGRVEGSPRRLGGVVGSYIPHTPIQTEVRQLQEMIVIPRPGKLPYNAHHSQILNHPQRHRV